MRDNPMRGECGARTRSGAPCRAPKVAGKSRCRMHGGAAGSGAPKGKRNGNWRHGRFTCEAIAERHAARSLLRSAHEMLAALARHAEAHRGPNSDDRCAHCESARARLPELRGLGGWVSFSQKVARSKSPERK